MENDGRTCSKCGRKMDHNITNWYSHAAYADWCLKCIRRNNAREGFWSFLSVVGAILAILALIAGFVRLSNLSGSCKNYAGKEKQRNVKYL